MRRSSELIFSLVLCGLIFIGLYLTSKIDLMFSSELESFTGPRAYPGMILGIMLALALSLVVKNVLEFKSVTEPVASSAGTEQSGTASEPAAGRPLAMLVVLIAIVLFVMLFEPVGYLLTMPLLLMAMAMLNGATRFSITLLVTLLMSLLCLLIFRYGLNTVLPEGVLGIDRIL